MTSSSDNLNRVIPDDLKERYSDFNSIGVGGMGRVFSAYDTRLKKRVAIKLLAKSVGDTSYLVMRFQQEAKAVSKLKNKHIVEVMDFGFTSNGDPYLIMEMVEGEDLDSRIETRGKMQMEEAIAIAIQVCNGLAHAHSNEVIHRDLKPSNIMLDANGNVKILDFGLARVLTEEEDGRLTKPGQPLGTLQYMSPEQMRGSDVGVGSDIYALGLVIYKLVSGLEPSASESPVGIIQSRLKDAPPTIPLTPGQENLSRELGNVVQKALEPDPNARFTGMAELKESLERILSHEKERTQARDLATKIKPRKEKTPVLVSLGMGLALVALGFVSFLVMQNLKPAPQTIPAREVTEVEKLTAPKENKTGEVPYGFTVEVDDLGNEIWIAAPDQTDQDLKKLHGREISSLSLRGNEEVTDEGMKIVCSLPLVALDLLDTKKISDASIPQINRLSNLQSLCLRGTAITNHGLTQLRPSATLVRLDMKYLKLTDDGLKYIVKSFPNLMSLNIGDTACSNTCLKVLKPLHHLQSVYVGDLEIGDDQVDDLVALAVPSFELAGNPITDKALLKLKKLKNIKWVSFEHTKVSQTAIDDLLDKFHDMNVHAKGSPEPIKELIDLYDQPK